MLLATCAIHMKSAYTISKPNVQRSLWSRNMCNVFVRLIKTPAQKKNRCFEKEFGVSWVSSWSLVLPHYYNGSLIIAAIFFNLCIHIISCQVDLLSQGVDRSGSLWHYYRCPYWNCILLPTLFNLHDLVELCRIRYQKVWNLECINREFLTFLGYQNVRETLWIQWILIEYNVARFGPVCIIDRIGGRFVWRWAVGTFYSSQQNQNDDGVLLIVLPMFWPTFQRWPPLPFIRH